MCTAFEIGKRKMKVLPCGVSKAAAEKLEVTEGQLMRPTLSAPVIAMDGELEKMRWGFRRKFNKAVVNAREDKLGGGMWRESMEKRRRLIPATGYYEWSGPTGNKRTHLFRHAEGDWLWIAGIWEEDAELGRCCSMITTSPTGVVRGVHDRMPAVLSPEQTGVFLEGRMKTFSPAAGWLAVRDAVNPLTGRKPGAVQGELF